jgi:predicted small secreted protein
MPRALTAALLTALLGLSACNTMEGFGRDLENTGDAIEEEASD